MINERVFREYDIRGIIAEDLDRRFAFLLGKAFVSLLKRKVPEARTVSIGRDVRLSSEELAAGLIEGITSSGLKVINIGVCPTPLQYFSLYHLKLDGGIMVTGSHNPPEYNGFKLSTGRETLFGHDIQELKKECLQLEAQGSTFDENGPKGEEQRGKVEKYDIIAAYKKYMLNEFSYLGGAQFRRMRVVVDAGNGTGGLVAPEVLESMGCEVIPLYCEPDGSFPNHHPDPTVVAYIQDLIRTTKETGADIGIGYDGDSDRIGVVDGNGEVVWGDQLMILLSREMLKTHPGAKVIGDVKCSQHMFDDIRKRGGTPIMWKTGHSLVKQKMRDESAICAGEFSGHIFIGDRYFGFDDALYTTFRIVEIMKKNNAAVSELLSDVPKVFFTPEIRLDCPDERKGAVVGRIVKKFVEYKDNGPLNIGVKDVNTTDGVRVVFEKGWGLARSSNTQPVVVMRVEAGDEESLKVYRDLIEKEFEEAMGRS